MSIDSKPTCPIISRFAEDLKLTLKVLVLFSPIAEHCVSSLSI